MKNGPFQFRILYKPIEHLKSKIAGPLASLVWKEEKEEKKNEKEISGKGKEEMEEGEEEDSPKKWKPLFKKLTKGLVIEKEANINFTSLFANSKYCDNTKQAFWVLGEPFWESLGTKKKLSLSSVDGTKKYLLPTLIPLILLELKADSKEEDIPQHKMNLYKSICLKGYRYVFHHCSQQGELKTVSGSNDDEVSTQVKNCLTVLIQQLDLVLSSNYQKKKK